MKKSIQYDFLIFGEKCIDFADEIIVNVVKSIPEIEPTQIKLIRNYTKMIMDNSKIHIDKSYIIFVKSDLVIDKLNNLIKMNNLGYKKFHHLVVIQNKVENKIKFPKDLRWTVATPDGKLRTGELLPAIYHRHIMNFEVIMSRKNK